MPAPTRELSLTPNDVAILARSDGPRGRRALAALGLWIMGCAAAVLTFLRVDELTERDTRAQEAREATALAASVAHSLAIPIELLRGLSGLLATFPELGSAPFQDYADHVASEQPAVTGMHLRRLVGAAERAAFERAAGFAITDPGRAGSPWRPALPRALHLPVVLRADWEDRGSLGEDLLGGDVASRVEQALSDGTPVAYVRGGARARAEALCLLEPAEALAPPSRPARAFAEVCVDLERLVRTASAGSTAGAALALRIFDLSSPAGQHLIYVSSADPEAPGETAWSEAALARHDLRLGGRLWRVMVVRAASGAPSERPLGVLAAGLLAATLLAGLGFALATLAHLRRRLSRVERLGQYVLEEKLGSGGMGTVYRARHSLLRRPTAVKVIPASLRTSQALARFEREVRITASLSHPNTVAVYDFGRVRDGSFYYAMEYLDGLDLQRLVEQHGPQSEARVVHILLQAAGALSEAHAHGVIHRDVKPANLMLCTRGGILDFVKVLDFGLVKELRDERELARSDFVGTPLYAAPEASLAPQAMDARSDLYALGAVAFFLLSGREVFRGAHVIDVVSQHVSSPAPSVRELGARVSPGLDALIRACLAKAPAQRPASAVALRQTLEELARVCPWTDADAQRWWAEHRGAATPGENTSETARAQLALGTTQVAPRWAV